VQRLDLQQKSNEKAEKWTNTLDALRKNKDVQRYEQFRKEEEQRRSMDALEREYQVQQKKKLIAQVAF